MAYLIIYKIIPDNKLKFNINLASHCNLNCINCTTFSPIATKEYLDIQILENDLKRLASLEENRISDVTLMGGEPLLNKDISTIIILLHNYFPLLNISILTNGILLQKMEKLFWETCAEHNVKIRIDNYPIKINIEKIAHLATRYGANIIYHNKYAQRVQMHIPIDESGTHDVISSFLLCKSTMHNGCATLENGKIFPCTTPAFIRHFNKFFNKNVVVSTNDYINIYNMNSIPEILSLVVKPIPFCKYCNVSARSGGHKFAISNKSIKEWTGKYINGSWQGE